MRREENGGGNFVILATDRRKLGGDIRVVSPPSTSAPKNPDHPNVFKIDRGWRGKRRREVEYYRVTLSRRRFGLFKTEREAKATAKRLHSSRWAFTVLPWGPTEVAE